MGNHLLLEVYGVDYLLLNDALNLERVMKQGIERAGMTILNVFQYCFYPQGCTIVISLSESHVSCHTSQKKGALRLMFILVDQEIPN